MARLDRCEHLASGREGGLEVRRRQDRREIRTDVQVLGDDGEPASAAPPGSSQFKRP
jgi:hypothetical protein